jgi:hypothetical protein
MSHNRKSTRLSKEENVYSFVLVYENGTTKPVEIVLRKGRWGWWR